MKLAISNLAWHPAEEAAVRHELAARGLAGVEIAPTKVWPQPLAADGKDVARYRSSWEDAGIRIIALQSLLFGRSDLTIFGSAAARAATLDYLRGMIRLARDLGASVLVFGSPRNRAMGDTSPAAVLGIATDFFTRVAEAAAEAGVCFCLEPNPTAYGCDFVTTASEGQWWVQHVSHPGLGLHLDSGCLTLSRDPLKASLRAARPLLRHFHVSEPDLREIGTGGVAHDEAARALAEIRFPGWRSLEMRAPDNGAGLPGVKRALAFAVATYA